MPLTEFARTRPHFVRHLLLASGVCLALAGCDSDLQTSSSSDNDTTPTDVAPATGSDGSTSNDSLTLQVGSGQITLTEGEDAISVPVTVTRSATTSGAVQLSVTAASASDENLMTATFSDAELAAGESSTELSLQLAIDAFPIQAQTRTWVVSASMNGSAVLSTEIDIAVTPTSRPDVYLLVGQSNMVGFSEDNSKQADAGGLDAPDDRITQLNVTGNDGENFATAADFTTAASVYNEGLPISPAVDPLHDGFDTNANGKSGQRIGPALSFAKQALQDTTANIVLVPAAWSDTGFCKRDTNRLPGVGWNATEKNNSALAGTLLYDRAVLRANLALSQTDGILRAILWHQGEADSDDAACAEIYSDNLIELATALRTNIDEDARGAVARGADAELPFIVGTMSMGKDENSDQTPFSDIKLLVDGTHRNIASLIPLSGFVNNDDLVPTAYPCGEGSCIHFGAAAYREMGNRYYQELFSLMQ